MQSLLFLFFATLSSVFKTCAKSCSNFWIYIRGSHWMSKFLKDFFVTLPCERSCSKCSLYKGILTIFFFLLHSEIPSALGLQEEERPPYLWLLPQWLHTSTFFPSEIRFHSLFWIAVKFSMAWLSLKTHLWQSLLYIGSLSMVSYSLLNSI